MAYCSICNKKIGAMAPKTPLSEEPSHQSIPICFDCGDAVNGVLRGTKSRQLCVDYLSTYVSVIENVVVAEYVKSIIENTSGNYTAREQKQAELKKRVSGIKVTSGYNFEGQTIKEYLGFASSEVALGMGYFKAIAAGFANMLGVESDGLKNKLKEAKELVLQDMLHQAVNKNANAIIGMNLNYTMFGDSIVGVIMSGTLVYVE